MTTQHRFRGKYRLEIRERDHGSPHCHLVGGPIDVITNLTTLTSEGAWPRGLRSEIMDWVEAQLEDPWREWNRWHA